MKIIKGKQTEAVKVLIYGVEGIGKSTLASKFPGAVFIDTEGSTKFLDVARTEPPCTWSELMDQVNYFFVHPEEVGTLVIDTIDWAEKMCIEQFLLERKVKGIEDILYGKGYVYIAEEMGRLLERLEAIRRKGVNILLTAHAQMRKFEQPDELGSYDRWELKLTKKTASLVKEAMDMILFCNYKTMVVNVDNKGAQKGKNKAQGGRRIMYTQHHPCWDAKNRFGLPEELDMDYEAIRGVIEPAAESDKTKQTTRKSQKTTKKPAETAPATSAPADEDPEVPAKSTAAETQPEESSLVSIYLSNPDNLPAQLKDLMEKDQISEWEIEQVVFARGYFPMDTPIEKMEQASPGFIEGWICQFWPKIKEMALQIRKDECVPFN